MHYLVDGYNLLFRTMNPGVEIQRQREALIEDLSTKAKLLNLNVTVIFDSHFQQGESHRTHKGCLEIIYTAEKESADEHILKLIRNLDKPRETTVVTSDRVLASRAKLFLVHTQKVEAFTDTINRRYASRLTKKNSPPEKKAPVVAPEPEPPKKLTQPAKTLSAEECSNFYLELFEKKFQEIEAAKPPKKKEAAKAQKSKKIKKNITHSQEPDMDRWLRIFEEKKD